MWFLPWKMRLDFPTSMLSPGLKAAHVMRFPFSDVPVAEPRSRRYGTLPLSSILQWLLDIYASLVTVTPAEDDLPIVTLGSVISYKH